MGDVEDAVVPPSKLAESSGAYDTEENETNYAKDDILVSNAFREEAGDDEKVHVEDGMQDKQEKNDSPKDLVRGLQLFMGESCNDLDWRVWRSHGQQIMER